MTAPYQSSLVTHSYSLWDSSFGSLRFDLALSKILLWAKKSGTSSLTGFQLGLLLNFGQKWLRDGIDRVVNDL